MKYIKLYEGYLTDYLGKKEIIKKSEEESKDIVLACHELIKEILEKFGEDKIEYNQEIKIIDLNYKIESKYAGKNVLLKEEIVSVGRQNNTDYEYFIDVNRGSGYVGSENIRYGIKYRNEILKSEETKFIILATADALMKKYPEFARGNKFGMYLKEGFYDEVKNK